MNRTPVVPVHRRRERGQALAYAGITLLTLMGFAVIGVDVARLAFTAAEVQSIADAAATAGAGALANKDPNPTAVATAVVQQNYVDAKYGTVGGSAADVVKSITPGIWNFDAAWNTDPFVASTWGDPNANAVRVVARAQVQNMIAPVFGVLHSNVERQSTAAMGGACTELVTLPIAIEHDAIQQFLNSPDCRNIPVTRLFQVPVDNSCFTSLSTASAGSGNEKAHVPAQCQGSGGNSGGGQTETLNINDSIRLDNGQQDSVLKTIAACLNASPPLNEFVVPVIPDNSCCGGCAQPVVSFARIIIDHVQTTGASSQKGVYIKGVCKEDFSGTNPGCATGGENAMTMVK